MSTAGHHRSAALRRSNSGPSLKQKSKTALMDSNTLQGMLGLTPSLGKPAKTKEERVAKRKNNLLKKKEYRSLVDSILMEETGLVGKRRKRKKKPGSILTTAFQYDEQKKTNPVDKESVVSYSSAFGCFHDDILFLDNKYSNIKFRASSILSKLEHGYETIIQRDDNMMTVEDAVVLLSYAEIELDSAVFDASIEKSIAPSKENGRIISSPSKCDVERENDNNSKISDSTSHSPSTNVENDMTIKDISTAELNLNVINEPSEAMTTDMVPVDLIYYDIWVHFIEAAVRLKLAQDALAQEKGVVIESTFPVHSPKQGHQNIEIAEDLFGFQALEKELKNGLATAYSQSLANFNFSADHNDSSTLGMLRSKSQPTSDVDLTHNSERLAPLRLKKLRKQESMLKTKSIGNFDGKFGRETPRCLRPGESQHESTGSFSAIEELRRELQVANEGLMHLDSMVAENIQWVHSNCDVKGVLGKKGHGLSQRAVSQCRKIAVERLADVFESYIAVTLRSAFTKLKRAVALSNIAKISRSFSRGKSIEILANSLAGALRRQFKRMFQPWVLRVRWETRWEQEAATVEIQRVGRSYLAKRRVFLLICELKSVIIQCCIRVFLAKCRVERAKAYRALHKAATMLKYFIKSRVEIHLAKARVQRRREERAALVIQRVFRGFQARQKTREIRDLIALRQFSATQIQKIYRSKIKGYYAVLVRKKYLEDERIAAAKEAKRVAARRHAAAVQIQSHARRIIAVRRVNNIRHEKFIDHNACIIQRFFRRLLETKKDRENLVVLRKEHAAATKIQSVVRMRLGKRKMDKRREDKRKGRPLEWDTDLYGEPYSFDKEDPVVLMAAVKLQCFGRRILAQRLANDKRKQKKKSWLRFKGRKKDPSEGESDRGFSVRRLLSRGASRDHDNPPSSRKSATPRSASASSSKRQAAPEGSASSRPVSAKKSVSLRPESGKKSSAPSPRPTSGKSSVAPSPRPESGKKSASPRPEAKSDNLRPESAKKSTVPSPRPTSGKSSAGPESGKKSVSIRPESAKKSSEPSPRPESAKKSVSLRPESAKKSSEPSPRPTSGKSSVAPSPRPESGKKSVSPRENIDTAPEQSINENNAKGVESPVPPEEPEEQSMNSSDKIKVAAKRPKPIQPKTPSRSLKELGVVDQEASDVTDGSINESQVKSPPSSSKGILNRSPSKVRNAPPPQLTGGGDAVDISEDNIQEDLENDKKRALDELEKTNKESESTPNVVNSKDQNNDDLKEDTEQPVVNQEDKNQVSSPLSRQPSKRSQSPGLLRQASKFLNRSISTPDPGTPNERKRLSRSPSRAESPMQKMKSMFSMRSLSLASSKKRVYKPKDRTLVPRSDDEAAVRIQSIVRQRLGFKKVKAKKKEVRSVQKKAGLIVLWAIVTIQRVMRGQLGRWKWKRIHKQHKDRLQKEENDRIWKELEEEEEKEREKQRLADELEEKNNRMWSKYGKKNPEETKAPDNETKNSADDESSISKPDPVPTESPLRSTEALHADSKVSELDERMRRLEEMEKKMLEKEEKMIEAAKKAEEKAQEMQRAIEAMEKRAAEEEAEKQVRRSMMELAAGPMGSIGSSLGPQRSSRPSARPMGSSRSKGPNSSRPPPSARSAKDGTPRPREVLKVVVRGAEWIQLWDPDESAWYWYCESTGEAQWDQPTEMGYESGGGLTDYSTENDGWYTESESGWQEFWDEQAQAKYWYNTATGEASWTAPEGGGSSVGSLDGPGGDEWVSYIDDATGEEYWYNAVTGETSWS